MEVNNLENFDQTTAQVAAIQVGKFKEYRFVKSLGQGSFGNVDLVEKDGKMFALKTFNPKGIRDEASKQYALKYFRSEIENMSKLKHPNLVNYIDSVCENNEYQILIEYCNQGSFNDYIKVLKSTPGKYNEDNILRIFQQILQGFNHLSMYCILHRDIKPDNILFNDGIPKVADFGLSKALNNSDDTTRTRVGTQITMAPELFLGNEYSNKADIYSLGTLLYFMLQENFPFVGNSPKQLFDRIQSGIITYNDNKMIVSEETKKFISLMTNFDPSNRPDLGTLLLNPLFKPISAKIDDSQQQNKLMEKNGLDVVETKEIDLKSEQQQQQQQHQQQIPINIQNQNLDLNQYQNQQKQQEYFQQQLPQQKQIITGQSNESPNHVKNACNLDPKTTNTQQKNNNKMPENIENQPFSRIKYEQYPHLLKIQSNKQMEDVSEQFLDYEIIDDFNDVPIKETAQKQEINSLKIDKQQQQMEDHTNQYLDFEIIDNFSEGLSIKQNDEKQKVNSFTSDPSKQLKNAQNLVTDTTSQKSNNQVPQDQYDSFKEKLSDGTQLFKINDQILYIYQTIRKISCEPIISETEQEMWDCLLFFILQEMKQHLITLNETMKSQINNQIMCQKYEEQKRNLESFIIKVEEKIKPKLTQFEKDVDSKEKLNKQLQKLVGIQCIKYERRMKRVDQLIKAKPKDSKNEEKKIIQEQYMKAQLLLWNIVQFALRKDYFKGIEFNFDKFNQKISNTSFEGLQEYIESAMYDFPQSK